MAFLRHLLFVTVLTMSASGCEQLWPGLADAQLYTLSETGSGGHGFDSHRGQKIFSLPRVVPCFSLLGLTPSGLFMGLSSTIIYNSELIFCSTIWFWIT